MNGTDTTGRTPLFYVNTAAGACFFLVALTILTGGFAFSAGPLNISVTSVRIPAVALLVLLLARHLLLARSGEEPSWRHRFFGDPDSSRERWRAVELLALLTLLFTVVAAVEVSARYGDLQTDGFGLAAAAQALWNTMHGRFLATTLGGGGSYLGLHFSPGLVLLAPLVSWWQAPLALEWVALFTLALGAWPAYMIALRDTGERRWAVAVAALYLAHPLLRGAGLHGFDPGALAVTPLLIAFYLLDDKRRLSGYGFLLVALTMSEGTWLAASLLGLYLSVGRRRWREGLFLFLPTFYGYLFIVSFVMPRLGSPVLPTLGAWSHLGGTMGEVLKNILLHPGEALALVGGPGRLTFLLLLFAPLAFLPLLSPIRLLPALPLLLAGLLAGDPLYHGALSPLGPMMVPFFTAAASAGLARLLDLVRGRRVGEGLRLALAGALLLATLLAFDAVPLHGSRSGSPAGFAAEFTAAAGSVPEDASLAASGTLLPYLCRREAIRQLSAAEHADYVVVDLAEMRREPGGRERGEQFAAFIREKGLAIAGGGRSVVALGPSAGGKGGAGEFEKLLDR